jgi:hypothetical protein
MNEKEEGIDLKAADNWWTKNASDLTWLLLLLLIAVFYYKGIAACNFHYQNMLTNSSFLEDQLIKVREYEQTLKINNPDFTVVTEWEKTLNNTTTNKSFVGVS